ncbi:MAG: diguanylate cyclase [Thermoleophilia bacterium]
MAVSYQNARQLAIRLGLDSSEKLAHLFRDLGMGQLSIDVKPETIVVSLAHQHAPAKLPASNGPACELERGIIDGALEIITGMPVKTSETSCWTTGSRECVFEAFLDMNSDRPRYAPGIMAARPDSKNGHDRDRNRDRMRTWYLDLAARELAKSRRHGRPLSFIYLDLDDLGRVNTEHGRRAGDQIINAVSAVLSRTCRTEDFLWHHGEDEFALVLAETDTEAADVVASRLSTAIFSAAENIDFAARISASIGYSTFPAHGDDLASLLESARSAQYLAKARGKGRTQVAVSAPPAGEDAASAYPASSGARRATVPGDHNDGFVPRQSAAEPESDASSLDTDESPITLVVALSGPLLMAGIKQLLGENKNIMIAEEVADPLSLAGSIEDARPDMIITDMAIAAADDFAVPRIIREENLPCKLMILAEVIDQEVIKIASDFTIDAIVLQGASPQEILDAISTAYKGKVVIPEEAKAAIKELEGQRQLLSELSERELEVLELIAEGKSNSQISQDLFITVNTVRFHLANIYQKLSVSNRTEAANCYLKQDKESDSQPRLL